MKIKSYAKEYEVIFEKEVDFLCKYAPDQIEKSVDIPNAGANTFYVIDRNVYELYAKYFEQIPKERLFLLDAIESNKTIETALEICEVMTALNGKRNAVLFSAGGGITQDVTGFVSNILYRGIHWIFVPTTLLAASDSCIGSKTSLNYKSYKNLLGTFYPPDELHICPPVFATLTRRDFLSGLGEVVKFNIMAGNNEALDGCSLGQIEQDLEGLINREPLLVEQYVNKSLNFKKPFIEADEFDKGIRIHLNFAHTFGHAFEAITDYAIPHGTAVAMGMIMANAVACGRGNISEDLMARMEAILVRIIDLDLLKRENGFKGLETFEMNQILDKIKKDKKQVDAAITAVIFENESLVLKIVHDVTAEEVEAAYNRLLQVL